MSTAEGTTVAESYTPHIFYPVNIRITVPFLPRPFFIALIAGPERRGVERLKEERARHPLNTWGNLAIFVAASTVFTIALFFTTLVAAAL